MSVVVAVRDQDKIWLATDSQVTSGWTKHLLLSQHSFKIFKMPHGINLAGVGSLRDLNIISTSDIEYIPENAILKKEITFKGIVRDTVPKLFKELENFQRISKIQGVAYMNSEFIIAHDEECFMICEDGSVMELLDMFAIGSGGNIAESAYTILRDTELSPKDKAVRAVISSCERDLFVDYPIIITNTKIDSFEIFDGEFFYALQDGDLIEIPEEEELSIEEQIQEIKEEDCNKNIKNVKTRRRIQRRNLND